MAATDVIHVSAITATTASVYTGHEDIGSEMDFTIYASDGTTVVKSVSGSDPGWSLSAITVSGLTPNTTYVAKLDNEPSITFTFTTLSDSPKVATESMWADLANRIKAMEARVTTLEGN